MAKAGRRKRLKPPSAIIMPNTSAFVWTRTRATCGTLISCRQRTRRLGKCNKCSLIRSKPPGMITLAEVFRAVEEDDPFVMTRKKPNRACPVGNCIQIAIAQVFTSARKALEKDLEKTTLGDVLGTVNSCCDQPK